MEERSAAREERSVSTVGSVSTAVEVGGGGVGGGGAAVKGQR